MKRKVLIAFLMLLKFVLAKGQTVTLRIRYGMNKGLLWKFNNKSNNEFILGTWEEPMYDVYERYIKENDIVYDLGAHQGYLALMASRLVGDKGRVYAFEPLPGNYDLLKTHVDINKVTNCIPIFGAVAEKAGVVSFSTAGSDVANTYISSSPLFSNNPESVEVPCFSLDVLLEAGTIKPPKFIKVDVEGAELDVLKGASSLLINQSPIVYLETHNVHRPRVDEECRSFLTSLGYRMTDKLITPKEGLMSSYIFEKA